MSNGVCTSADACASGTPPHPVTNLSAPDYASLWYVRCIFDVCNLHSLHCDLAVLLCPVDQDVICLDIRMDDPLAMQVRKATQCISENPLG
jgi:hypothetical protein